MRSDVGIALSSTGSDISRRYADVILKTDRFKDINETLFRSRNLIIKI